jgi:protein-tyrosine phosphatase
MMFFQIFIKKFASHYSKLQLYEIILKKRISFWRKKVFFHIFAQNFNMKKHRILFVCHGNICRSPMAEFILKDMVEKSGIADNFEIASAATSTEEIGNDIYPPAKRILFQKGIKFESRQARQITRKDYDYYDFIIAMDENNLRNLRRMLGDDTKHKISLMMSYAGKHRDVADPWYTGDFETTYRDLIEGCEGFLRWLKEQYPCT